MIYVPKQGVHRLKVQASKSTTVDAYSLEPVDEDSIIFTESFPLESGTNHRVFLRQTDVGKRVQVYVVGQNKKYIDFPFGRMDPYSRAFSNGLVVIKPNQIGGMNRGGKNRYSIGQTVISKISRVNRFGSAMLIRLFVESDGPMASSPDDPSVVRMLLQDFDAGKDPKFKFTPEGSYEFEE